MAELEIIDDSLYTKPHFSEYVHNGNSFLDLLVLYGYADGIRLREFCQFKNKTFKNKTRCSVECLIAGLTWRCEYVVEPLGKRCGEDDGLILGNLNGEILSTPGHSARYLVNLSRACLGLVKCLVVLALQV